MIESYQSCVSTVRRRNGRRRKVRSGTFARWAFESGIGCARHSDGLADEERRVDRDLPCRGEGAMRGLRVLLISLCVLELPLLVAYPPASPPPTSLGDSHALWRAEQEPTPTNMARADEARRRMRSRITRLTTVWAVFVGANTIAIVLVGLGLLRNGSVAAQPSALTSSNA